jgi:hypothetical protein
MDEVMNEYKKLNILAPTLPKAERTKRAAEFHKFAKNMLDTTKLMREAEMKAGVFEEPQAPVGGKKQPIIITVGGQ